MAGALLALGATLGPLFEFLHGTVPFRSRFRVVSYAIIWSALALALLAARGTSRATMTRPATSASEPRRTRLVGLGVVAALGFAISLAPLRGVYVDYAMAARPRLSVSQANVAAQWAGFELVALALLVGITLELLARARTQRTWAKPALVLLVAIDLAAVSAPVLWRSSGSPSLVAPPPAPLLAQVAVEAPHTRVYVGAAEPVVTPSLAMGQYSEAYTNFWISWRVRSLVGNHGAYPSGWMPVIQSGLTRSASECGCSRCGLTTRTPS